jgi:hypothetical protein
MFRSRFFFLFLLFLPNIYEDCQHVFTENNSELAQLELVLPLRSLSALSAEDVNCVPWLNPGELQACSCS